ncbi:hypothetical protein A1F94_005979 [Pyrenophora tritici-repentis]|uniref:Uncharacterized protein n=1 Tax=Pyrenophora tritici-repentis TaxID=45151 RepID=A0A317A5U2_9PLEO|nr:hypothetical protein PtrV1_07947 [Pyrenophora tritici-repentis]KAF7448991.1 hypothetical protein A1F99_060400 [Pyrenophora tritici-repentis]KAF7571015.1 hypothetical protein PtrM4_110170 [Pyrenophora tritici-repentis]KAG9384068.1 hypothetical protein A1F94_005979 [Pyrenophora tritici-repentis]KAI0581384.1 hypothetical protein Alg215_04721 [Pyrenophora tritici-repentis]
METFHPFPRFPLELRIQIWESAAELGRVVKVRKLHGTNHYSSPTPAPAVTRACRESRKYCVYQKIFVVDRSPRYIWTCLETDVIQMDSYLIKELVKEDSLEKQEVRYLRLELMSFSGWDASDFFYHDHSRRIRHFPKLERFDVLVNDGLYNWGHCVMEINWGAIPRSNVRIIDAKTGQWIHPVSAGLYLDCFDTSHGGTRDYIRIVDGYDEEKDGEERYQAMVKMKEPLPQIDLNY